MSGWLRVLWVLMVLVVPGAFLVLAAYATARAVRTQYGTAKAQRQHQPLVAALSRVRIRDVVREARASL